MTVHATTRYETETDLPPLVTAAVEVARQAGFENSRAPEQGRLLQLLAAGAGAGPERRGTFDLLVLDGGGQDKGAEPPLEPSEWLRPGGLVVIDDFAPMTGWPPRHDGRPDEARLYWLEHPRLRRPRSGSRRPQPHSSAPT